MKYYVFYNYKKTIICSIKNLHLNRVLYKLNSIKLNFKKCIKSYNNIRIVYPSIISIIYHFNNQSENQYYLKIRYVLDINAFAIFIYCIMCILS